MLTPFAFTLTSEVTSYISNEDVPICTQNQAQITDWMLFAYSVCTATFPLELTSNS
jgi:hypothetical protein